MGRTSDAKERLIESGRELMHERGYTAVGVSEVCDRAGVNKGSFYHFFPSKQALALAVIDSFWSISGESLNEMTEGSGPPLQRFRNFFRQSYMHHKGIKENCGKMLGCPLGNLALEMSTQDPVLAQNLKDVFARYVRGFQTILEQAVESGELPQQDTGMAARSVMALIEGTIMMAKMGDNPELLNGLDQEALKLVGFPRES